MFSSASSGSFRILFMGIQPPMVGHDILHPFQNCWCLFSQVKFFIYLALQEQPGSEAIGAGPVPTGPSLGALPHWVVRGSCGFLKQEPGSALGVPRICQAAQGNRPADLWLCVTANRSNSMTCATTTLLAFESNCLTKFAPFCCVHWQSWCILSLRGDS